MYLGQSDQELLEMIDHHERFEVTPEEYETILAEKQDVREAALAEGEQTAQEAIREAAKNGAPPPIKKAGFSPTYLVGVGLVALAGLVFLRQREKKKVASGPKKSNGTKPYWMRNLGKYD